jgi:hypothetical protein
MGAKSFILGSILTIVIISLLALHLNSMTVAQEKAQRERGRIKDSTEAEDTLEMGGVDAGKNKSHFVEKESTGSSPVGMDRISEATRAVGQEGSKMNRVKNPHEKAGYAMKYKEVKIPSEIEGSNVEQNKTPNEREGLDSEHVQRRVEEHEDSTNPDQLLESRNSSVDVPISSSSSDIGNVAKVGKDTVVKANPNNRLVMSNIPPWKL